VLLIYANSLELLISLVARVYDTLCVGNASVLCRGYANIEIGVVVIYVACDRRNRSLGTFLNGMSCACSLLSTMLAHQNRFPVQRMPEEANEERFEQDKSVTENNKSSNNNAKKSSD
jgi:hypothetical protein